MARPYRGRPFMTSTRKSGFWPLHLSTCVHTSLILVLDVHKPSMWDTHHSLETASTLVQWPSRHKGEIRL